MIQPQADNPDQPSRLRLSVISKRFGSTQALSNVSMEVEGGQAIAVIGENGAGKSTLMKVLAGIVSPDQGQIELDGQVLSWSGPRDAIDAGIALIHQELNLHDNLSVAENLFLGREPSRFGLLDRAELRRTASSWLDRVGLSVSPDAPVGPLPIASKQLIEIARALSTDARVVIMDEPTSSLSEEESLRLFELIERLREEGVAILYISHRLHEIIRLADRVEVLRDGEHVETLTKGNITHDSMVRAMVGRDLTRRSHETAKECLEPRLTVSGLRVGSRAAPPVDLQVLGGEVVALVGLVGAGRTEIVETIFGVRERFGGEILIDSEPLKGGVDSAIAAGLALVPEDRKRTGLLIQSSVRDNATIVSMTRDGVFRNRKTERATAAELIDRLRVKTASQEIEIASLSGGNQQKVALAKWLAGDVKVLMLDEPTRGVDIGAKSEIYEVIDQLASQGMGVLVVSSEMEEVFAIADRVIVISDGCVAGELTRSELTEEAIMRLAVAKGEPAQG
ncbi:sugar ABC transporter ATP-binding protein [Rhodopirellula baltica SH28]|uniref:Sugar ABC transporter ATP-binding protein n=1 Tax=Rhodopirellula baltica SH28 TaxID=993517 RepID=K5DKK1_RHOBT|nr:sugar ABC transporter ATP-binding protein [Rhodopirellula baltica]EKK03414.1 sugar ABC transporter ATP-binding protein [Rhodopirellula baltica SH28]